MSPIIFLVEFDVSAVCADDAVSAVFAVLAVIAVNAALESSPVPNRSVKVLEEFAICILLLEIREELPSSLILSIMLSTLIAVRIGSSLLKGVIPSPIYNNFATLSYNGSPF